MSDVKEEGDSIPALVGNADSIEALRAQIRHLVSFDGVKNPHVPTVLLLGETGTGKGLVARGMHESGPRARGPFIDVNCAAIPETMLESELFGFEAGAFTDARRPKAGLFEAASGGTLFLDEIDALTGPLQGKILKAIEEKRVRRLGAVEAHHVDVKLIVATQTDLRGRVEGGTFRADLYHRLAVVILTVPPLRERGSDVTLLAEHFLTTYGDAHGLPPRRLTAEAIAWLRAQPWPGNVRELGHLMERVTLLSPEADVGAEHLAALAAPAPVPPKSAVPPSSPPPASDDEAALIRDALARSGGNVVAAARLLGIGRNALRYRMRRHGIARPALGALGAAAPAGVPDASPATGVEPAPAGGAGRERKQVAVLAIELTFPERGEAERSSYEPWTVVRRWQEALTDAVRGFGGSFLPHGPSRSTAVFGAPRALEQIPVRAIRAALAVRRLQSTMLRDAVPELRAALHLGTIELDGVSEESLGRMRPIGDTLTLAERLLGHASAGEILVSEPLAHRVRSVCDLEPRELRVGSTPLTAFVVAAPRPQGARGFEEEARFVGREAELDLLGGAFASAAAGGGQVAFVMGDAGLGKSRLLAEFRGRLADTDHLWVEGHCESYGASTALLPIADALRRLFGIDEADDERGAAAKVATGLAALGDELAWTRPFLEAVLSLRLGDQPGELDAASWRSETFRALKALLLRLAETRPLVLLIEDLHWIDPASEDLIVFLAEAVPTARVLLVCSHRPGYRKPIEDRTYHLQLALRPLSEGEMTMMTGTLLAGGQLPEAWRRLIAQKAEGNPFFVEEVTKSLLEDGSLARQAGGAIVARDVAELIVPDTIQDVLLARIDRLPDEARRAIQVAAVIGREFVLRLLARIVEGGAEVRGLVDELRTLELVYEKATHPELAYMFKHALTHDVAYGSIVPERRRALHCTIGEAVEELYADRLAEHYETLAYHFTESEEWGRAFDYHERAAEKAASTHANRAVVAHCRAASEIAAHRDDVATPEMQRRLRYLAERHGLAALQTSEFADSGAAFERAAALATTPNGQAVAFANAAVGYFWAHDYRRCLHAIDRAVAIARAAKLPGPEAMALTTLGWYRAVHDADLDAYEQSCHAAAALSATIDQPATDAAVRYQRVMFAEWVGDYATVLALADGVVADARRLGLPHLVVLPSWFLGKALCCLGRYGESLARLDEAYAFCDRIGDRAWRSRLLNTLGWCHAEIGDHVAAQRFNERAAVIAHEFGDPEIIANSEINLAACAIALGDPEGALRRLEPIEAELERPGDPWMRWRYSLHVDDLLTRLAVGRGDLDAAEARVQRTLDGARKHRAPKLEARALVLQADVLLSGDRRADAAASLDAALAVATQIGYVRAGWQAHALLAELARRAGRTEGAAEHEAARRALVERVGAGMRDAGLRELLLRTALGPR